MAQKLTTVKDKNGNSFVSAGGTLWPTIGSGNKGAAQFGGSSGSASTGSAGSTGGSSATASPTVQAVSTGSTGGGSDAYAQLKNIYDAQADAQRRARRAAYDAAVKAQRAEYEQNVNKVNSAADKALREAYINKMQTQRTLGQQMAAQGLNGGYSETTAAGLQNNYGNARNELETERNSQLNDLNITLQNNLAAAENILHEGTAKDMSQYYTNLAALAASNPVQTLSVEQSGVGADGGTTAYNRLLRQLIEQGYSASDAARIAAGSDYSTLYKQYFG